MSVVATGLQIRTIPLSSLAHIGLLLLLLLSLVLLLVLLLLRVLLCSCCRMGLKQSDTTGETLSRARDAVSPLYRNVLVSAVAAVAVSAADVDATAAAAGTLQTQEQQPRQTVYPVQPLTKC